MATKAKNETQAAEGVDETLVAAGEDIATELTDVTDVTAPDASAVPELVRARVLAQCDFGIPNDVVEVDEALAKSRTDVLDTDPAAVAYALSQVV